MSGDDQAKGRRGQKTGQKTVLTAHMPQHQREWVRRVIDEYLYDQEMPPRYRRQLERLNREADARKKAERDEENTP